MIIGLTHKNGTRIERDLADQKTDKILHNLNGKTLVKEAESVPIYWKLIRF